MCSRFPIEPLALTRYQNICPKSYIHTFKSSNCVLPGAILNRILNKEFCQNWRFGDAPDFCRSLISTRGNFKSIHIQLKLPYWWQRGVIVPYFPLLESHFEFRISFLTEYLRPNRNTLSKLYVTRFRGLGYAMENNKGGAPSSSPSSPLRGWISENSFLTGGYVSWPEYS